MYFILVLFRNGWSYEVNMSPHPPPDKFPSFPPDKGNFQSPPDKGGKGGLNALIILNYVFYIIIYIL